MLAGCGPSNASSRGSQYVTVRTAGGLNQLALTAGGGIIGSRLQLSATATGYRGTKDSEMVDIRSDGKHVLGTIDERVIDLHVSVPPEGGIRAQGMFGNTLGRLEATAAGITSTLGSCHYDLQSTGQRYRGEVACQRRGRTMPVIRPVELELPPGFETLSVDRQAMVLAILLSD